MSHGCSTVYQLSTSVSVWADGAHVACGCLAGTVGKTAPAYRFERMHQSEALRVGVAAGARRVYSHEWGDRSARISTSHGRLTTANVYNARSTTQGQ